MTIHTPPTPRFKSRVRCRCVYNSTPWLPNTGKVFQRILTDEPDLARAAKEYADGAYHANITPRESGFWVEAKDLQAGDVFIGVNGELSVLIDIDRVELDEAILVYNFAVVGNHNYFVIAAGDEYGQTSVLVHNKAEIRSYTPAHKKPRHTLIQRKEVFNEYVDMAKWSAGLATNLPANQYNVEKLYKVYAHAVAEMFALGMSETQIRELLFPWNNKDNEEMQILLNRYGFDVVDALIAAGRGFYNMVKANNPSASPQELADAVGALFDLHNLKRQTQQEHNLFMRNLTRGLSVWTGPQRPNVRPPR